MRTTDTGELKRLFDALQHTGHRQYKTQLLYVHELFVTTPRFRAIFDLLKASTSDFDARAWMRDQVFSARQGCHEWPDAEPQKLCVLLAIMTECATTDSCDPGGLGRSFTWSTNLDECAQAVTKHVVYPLVDYLQTRLATESEVLHLLERMRRQVEWFEQEQLYGAFASSTTKGEALYDRRVREFLFAEGVDYPYSQPASASGRADVVAGLDGDDPLVCEVKLYDAGNYGAAYLRKGVGQAVRYAHDYGKPVAHLVVFNLSDDRLQVPSDGPPGASPPRLQIEGVSVFFVVVQAKPPRSASKDHRRQVRVLERQELVPTKEEIAAPAASPG